MKEIEQRIVQTIESTRFGINSVEIAKTLEISRITAKKYCDILVERGSVIARTVGRSTLFFPRYDIDSSVAFNLLLEVISDNARVLEPKIPPYRQQVYYRKLGRRFVENFELNLRVEILRERIPSDASLNEQVLQISTRILRLFGKAFSELLIKQIPRPEGSQIIIIRLTSPEIDEKKHEMFFMVVSGIIEEFIGLVSEIPVSCGLTPVNPPIENAVHLEIGPVDQYFLSIGVQDNNTKKKDDQLLEKVEKFCRSYLPIDFGLQRTEKTLHFRFRNNQDLEDYFFLVLDAMESIIQLNRDFPTASSSSSIPFEEWVDGGQVELEIKTNLDIMFRNHVISVQRIFSIMGISGHYERSLTGWIVHFRKLVDFNSTFLLPLDAKLFVFSKYSSLTNGAVKPVLEQLVAFIQEKLKPEEKP